MLNSKSCDLKKLEENIERERKLSLKGFECNDYGNDPHDRAIKRLESIRDFLNLGVKFEQINEGTLLVEDRFVFALRSFKWRVVGKSTWYRSRGPKDFVNRFVNKEKAQ